MIRKLVLIRNEIVTLEGSTQTALERVHQWAATSRFNTRACHEFFRPKGPKVTWAKLAWLHSLMPKYSFILWLGLKDKLLTREKLINQTDDCSCPLCGAPIESLNHLFVHCSEVRQVSTDIKEWLGFTWALTTIRAAAKWIIKEARGTGVQAIAKKVGFACTVYCIWKTRNARIFEGKILHPTGIIRYIKIQVYRTLHASFPNLRELWMGLYSLVYSGFLETTYYCVYIHIFLETTYYWFLL